MLSGPRTPPVAGLDLSLRKNLISRVEDEGGKVAVIGSKIQGEADSNDKQHRVDFALRASPSVLFDAVVVLAGPEGDTALTTDPNAVAFLMDAKRHCKAVGFSSVASLTAKAAIEPAPGIVEITKEKGMKEFMDAA